MHRPMPRGRRLAVSAAGALAVLAATAPSALSADQATLRLLGSSPIYANTVAVHKAGGGDINVKPARYHYRITTPSGMTEASGNCVDLSHYIVTGRDYAVELQDANDDPTLGSPEFKAAGWLLSQSDQLIASAADPGLEAGAMQVAIWQLSGQARGLDAPTSDLALNARVNTLRTLAMGKEVPSQLAVSIAGNDTCVDTAAPVMVTGTPGAEVDLEVTGGGTVQPDKVTLDEMGVGSAMVRASGAAATLTVHAEALAPDRPALHQAPRPDRPPGPAVPAPRRGDGGGLAAVRGLRPQHVRGARRPRHHDAGRRPGAAGRPCLNRAGPGPGPRPADAAPRGARRDRGLQADRREHGDPHRPPRGRRAAPRPRRGAHQQPRPQGHALRDRA